MTSTRRSSTHGRAVKRRRIPIGRGIERRADLKVRTTTRMKTILHILVFVAAPALLLAQAQSTELHIRYNSGQGVVPVYEGWERVPDGSFNMVFGYLNRNHVEHVRLPAGPQNNFEPGPADRGQPEYFYPRENHFLFRVSIPKDWDRRKELVWTLSANGKTEQARATLLDIWEIDRKVEVSNNGGGTAVSNALIISDQAPSITIAPPTQ